MIHVVLPVHNRRATSERFAAMLARQTVQDFALLLIDDGSQDGTADAVTDILPGRTTVLRGTGDWWWGGALQQAWLWLKARNPAPDDIILICNDDVDLPDDFLAAGTRLLAQHPRALAVAKARDPQSGAATETGFAVDFMRCRVAIARPDEPVVCAPTRGLFVRWRDMHTIGGFHPVLLPHYLSDLEWTLRAHRRGLAIIRDDSLWMTPHADATGFHGLAGLSFTARLRRMFSNKYAVNPLHWGTFVLLAFPVRAWIPALARVGLWTAGGVLGR
jgi:GT2 family glycosyltransferase